MTSIISASLDATRPGGLGISASVSTTFASLGLGGQEQHRAEEKHADQ